ncbi:glycosyltransferase family 29 protein [Pseudoscourfieldia marina]
MVHLAFGEYRPTLPGLLGIVLLCGACGHLPSILDFSHGTVALRPRAASSGSVLVERSFITFINQTVDAASKLEGSALLRAVTGASPIEQLDDAGRIALAASADDGSEALETARNSTSSSSSSSSSSFESIQRETAQLLQQVLAEETEDGEDIEPASGSKPDAASKLFNSLDSAAASESENATELMLEVQRMAREALEETRSMQRERETDEQKRVRGEWEPLLRRLFPLRMGTGFKSGPRNETSIFMHKDYLNHRKISSMLGTREEAVALMSHGCIPDVDSRLRYAQCAVVGSSWRSVQQGSRKSPQRYGKYVDNHDAVFRMNDAKGRDMDHTEFLGKRTDYRLLSMPWSQAVAANDFHKLSSVGHTAFANWKAAPSMNIGPTVFVLSSGLPFDMHRRACLQHRQTAMLRITPDLVRAILEFYKIVGRRMLTSVTAQAGRSCGLACRAFDAVTGGKRQISLALAKVDVPSGIIATALAMTLCRKVRLYGFSEESALRDIVSTSAKNMQVKRMRFRYFEDDTKMHHAEADKAILQLSMQAEVLSALEAMGRITICPSEPGKRVPRECAAKAIAGGIVDRSSERAKEVGRGGFLTADFMRQEVKASLPKHKSASTRSRADELKRRFFAAQARGGGLLNKKEMKKGLVAGLGDAAPILNDPNQADQQLATDAFDAEEATMMDERRR